LLLLRLDEDLLPLLLPLPLALARSDDLLLLLDEERPLFLAWAPLRPASLLLILPPEDDDFEDDEEEELRDAMACSLDTRLVVAPPPGAVGSRYSI
jgi:hypothetical protein